MEILIVCFIGAVLGTIIGILPGLTPSTVASLIFPFVLGMPVELGVILLTSLLYGSQYGGSTSAILFNIAGENSSILTTIDGHPLAKQGKAKLALFVSALSSMIGALISLGFIVLCLELISTIALKLSSIHYLIFLLISLSCFIVMKFKSSYSLLLGAALAMVGTINGIDRLVFDIESLKSGIDISTLAISLFGLSDVVYFYTIKRYIKIELNCVQNYHLKWSDIKCTIMPSLRGGIIGLMSVLPGLGHTFVTMIAYDIERRVSKNKDSFGTGAIEGVAVVESSNNSASQVALIPLLTLGVPTGVISSLVIVFLITKGITIDANIIRVLPNLLWAIVGINIILFIMNYTMVGVWVKLLSVNQHILNALIVLFCIFGLHSNMWIVLMLTSLGVYLKYYKYDVSYVIMGFIFAQMIEEYTIRVYSTNVF